MDLKMRKERIISWVMELKDETTLDLLDQFALVEIANDEKRNPSEVYVLSQTEADLLDEADAEIDRGDGKPHEQVKEEIMKWLSK